MAFVIVIHKLKPKIKKKGREVEHNGYQSSRKRDKDNWHQHENGDGKRVGAQSVIHATLDRRILQDHPR